VLDVGCGWGVNLLALESGGYTAIGLDSSRQILGRIDCPNRRLIEADLTQELPKQRVSADAMLVLDVIEHIDDDRAFLRRIAQLLLPGGVAVVSVPARPDLFSEFDRIQGHRRRYLPDSLRAAFMDSGLRVSQLFWWGAWMVPVLRRMRSVNKTYTDYLQLPWWPLPLAMQLLYALEQPIAMSGKLITGTSLFAVAERDKDIASRRDATTPIFSDTKATQSGGEAISP
jgi:SAM-dependent methyltransferase